MKRIVVLQRGWIVVGEYSREGDDVVVSNASVIRRWGTTRGLGQLALSGPTPETVLDPCGIVREHYAGIVFTLDTEESLWN